MDTNQNTDRNIVEAATVILTRERAGSLQIYLLKRSSGSGFMPGYYVFPGGTLDNQDRDINVFKTHTDLNLNQIAARFGEDLTAESALSFGVAAIRETLEEAGVFLAVNHDRFEKKLKNVCSLRLAEHLPKDWLVKLVAGSNWHLTLTALSRWSHWITPELMERRFDTRFFMAEMPVGQYCRPDANETVQGVWISPEEALTGNMDGKIPLSPPTLVTLHELLSYRNLNELRTECSRRTWGQAILPRLVPLAKGAVIVEPWDPQYRDKEICIAHDDLPTALVPVGKPFSRIWYDGILWRPVRA
jgi:8-oxo-dGTP pyrophosphatase MutT (NUDIX family)